jgi:plastocyanin
MKMRVVVTGLVVIVALIAMGMYWFLKPGVVQASNVEVKIDNFSFSPTPLRVRVGTRITWKNRDDIPHTVVEDGKLFRSKVLDTDEEFAYTPTKRGIYKYYCSIHPKMTAEVVVE